MIEKWKDVKGFEGKYQVSNLGRVRSFQRCKPNENKILKHEIMWNGYSRVGLCVKEKKKRCKIHRLVAEAFIPNPDNLPEVNHKDGNKLNNHADNLEWVSRADNMKHAYANKLLRRNGENNGRSKLSKSDVDYIRGVYRKRDKEYGARPLAEKYGVRRQHIYEIISNRAWRQGDNDYKFLHYSDNAPQCVYNTNCL